MLCHSMKHNKKNLFDLVKKPILAQWKNQLVLTEKNWLSSVKKQKTKLVLRKDHVDFEKNQVTL